MISKEGKLTHKLEIPTPDSYMMHDFAITENYSIFFCLPLTFDQVRLFKRKPMIFFKHSQQSLYAILPRYAESSSEVKWFSGPSCYVFHIMNSWEEGNLVNVFGLRHDCAHFWPCEKRKDPLAKCGRGGFLWKWQFDLSKGHLLEEKLDSVETEFPVINNYFMGRKCVWGYSAPTLSDGKAIVNIGVRKFNLLDSSVKPSEFYYGPHKYAGEATFVPREGATSEDDGYLMTFVFDESNNKSELWILNAKTMDNKPLARISLPRRVPYGFHGKWLSRSEIDTQIFP